METKEVLQLAGAATMIIGVVSLFCERIKTKKGIGVRVIQVLTVILVLPVVLILALEKIIMGETVATLIGAVIGYILSGIGKDEPTGDDRRHADKG